MRLRNPRHMFGLALSALVVLMVLGVPSEAAAQGCDRTTTCNNHGSCGPTGACVCDLGFTGMFCSACAQNYYA